MKSVIWDGSDSSKGLVTPNELKVLHPLSQNSSLFIKKSKLTVANIISGKDNRILIVCGPCSIHDPEAGYEYAKRLSLLSKKYGDKLFFVMRAYFEKPRTTVGWKGLINDPDMDGSLKIEKGLKLAREFLVKVAELEIPLATEALDPMTPTYFSDIFTWAAIGARTTESQIHRELASSLNMPVGFKNSTNGSIESAINGIISSRQQHHFIGINNFGLVDIIKSTGNPDTHVILRGGSRPNFDSASVNICESQISNMGLNPSIMVDCSHGNSNKNHLNQKLVALDVIQQINNGCKSIFGLMLESFLLEGRQDINDQSMNFGQSITDACLSWGQTEDLIQNIYSMLR
ncbi:3-deoxy-7-phosphoheptulonate synthase [Vibrio nitrifigilis]|uniref:Phospho-2-dehydro-3-deoxyheptonate aldolase n=1 Tax=Vibrio nitrifigilis TaxID=2789781 RepID=A0ABS0GFG8_9VIBR|nr:3-deoxy-7-phosphoheptulonate synthase [Vibrio nitrifigilis]MBF9001164.1 3-deoxy-7-phosphoheptulonate synthase [Vibrio nitrifigilis]